MPTVDFHALPSNPMHVTVPDDTWWTTTNTEEAHPGAMTPLAGTLSCGVIERCLRATMVAMGIAGPAELAIPERPEERGFALFCARFTGNLEFFAQLGDRVPGTSGAALTEQMFNFAPPRTPIRGGWKRYPIIAARHPTTFARAPTARHATQASTPPWWRSEIDQAPTLGLDEARRRFGLAVDRFDEVGTVDGICVLACIQPVYDQITRLAERAGVPSGALMAGHGSHEEADMVADIWECSRGRLPVETIVRKYGFQGPNAGDLGTRMWRENPDSLLRIVAGYAKMAESEDPHEAERERMQERERAEGEALAALPAARRPAARLLFRVAKRYLPLRGKVGRTQAMDVCRATARRAGECFVMEGILAEPEDVLYLTDDELRGARLADPRAVVAERREIHEIYRGLELPRLWQGNPDAVPTPAQSAAPATADLRYEGVPASPGTVEGRVRVIADPASLDMEPGEVLVCHTTDPSWAPVMFMASALVVDVGGLLSHAAVVARELGVPCVMGTETGTRELRTGDLVRVDGRTGEVVVLERA